MDFLRKLFARKPVSPAPNASEPARKAAAGAPPRPSSALAAKVQRLFQARDVDGLRQVARTGDKALTGLLAQALHSDPDPKVKIMAIDALGLTSDPQAVTLLVEVFQGSQGAGRKTAALSLANLVLNRAKRPEAIASLMEIARDKSLHTLTRSQSILALCQFRREHAEVEQLLTEILHDPDEDEGLRVSAMDLGKKR